MNRLIKTTTIKVGFAWTDWQFNDHPGVVPVAAWLNRRLEDLVNAGWQRDYVNQEMYLAFEAVPSFGAQSRSTLIFFENVLDYIFGEE